ncbi:hypothetical protein FRX31_014393, partial [Thalictrum thalictroides]
MDLQQIGVKLLEAVVFGFNNETSQSLEDLSGPWQLSRDSLLQSISRNGSTTTRHQALRCRGVRVQQRKRPSQALRCRGVRIAFHPRTNQLGRKLHPHLLQHPLGPENIQDTLRGRSSYHARVAESQGETKEEEKVKEEVPEAKSFKKDEKEEAKKEENKGDDQQ